MEPTVSLDEARSTAAEAYLYAFPMIASHRAMVEQAIDSESPRYIGGFNVLKSYAEPVTPDDRDVVAPNNDTRESWAWIDLRSEPFVISVPAVGHDRYYALQWNDLYTDIIGDVGVRTTGFSTGSYLIAGPAWAEDIPEGIDGVLRSETQFVTLLGRTRLAGPDDVPTLEAIQSQYRLEPLSQFQAQIPPPAAPPVEWPAWDDAALTSPAFIPYLNVLLQFCQPPRAAERDLLRRFARIGIGPGACFRAECLDPARRRAIADGVNDGIARLEAALATTRTPNGLYGTREQLGGDFLRRAVGASIGLFGNAVEEVWYGRWDRDADGAPLDGRRRYRLHFAAEALPPAQFFWSATMYDLPDRRLVANPINRYSIGSRTDSLRYEEEGSLAIEISNELPGDNSVNWLPAPAGPFTVIIRVYGPKPELLDGAWKLPPLVVMNDG